MDTGALSAASNAAAAAAQQSSALGNKSNTHNADTMINVEIVGFGGKAQNDCSVDEHGKSQCNKNNQNKF
ncbi:hypothetical protein [Acinetobacter sp. CFCC 10889]|uniref:hypothetical protein n=1 Tax=Acinetobacter sp. CFCC 10889 TaxID=1775557 RepID=UPI001D190430|nr:hypothetical protein [Acinetobacter sp. CFCC 10889]